MSRGLGKLQKDILEYLGSWIVSDAWAPRATDIAHWAADTSSSPYGAAHEASVRRALASLLARGLVVQDIHKRWRTVEAAGRKNKKERAQQSRRTRKARAEERAWERIRDAMKLEQESSTTGKLAKLLGMLGSDHDGEIVNAARLIEQERQRLGKTWADLLRR